jgi:hypothetical protein
MYTDIEVRAVLTRTMTLEQTEQIMAALTELAAPREFFVVQYPNDCDPDNVHIFESENDAERYADLRRIYAADQVDVWSVTPLAPVKAAEVYADELEGWKA